ncbi:MAG: LacI family DNA-binding transcriptional regulator [Oscillospiraceae bacterium]
MYTHRFDRRYRLAHKLRRSSMSIKKIAEIVGVSPSTVSRVLNKPEYQCSTPELRRRIFAAARELNYVPNQSAQNLRSGMTNQAPLYRLGIIVTAAENTDPFFVELLNLIESEIHKNSCILSEILYRSDFSDDEKNLGESDEIIDDTTTDGLIIIGKCSPKILARLKKQRRNIVCVNRSLSDASVDEVYCDGEKIAGKAVQYLIGLGHSAIAYVGECRGDARFRGYQKTMLENKLDIDLEYIIQARPSEAGGYDAMERIMQMKQRPSGIYCSNDIIAVGMLKALNKYKNRFYHPSVISSDNISESAYTTPMLTTVDLPKADIAKLAIILLIDRMNGGHKSAVKMETESSIIIRSSCSSVEHTDPVEYYI